MKEHVTPKRWALTILLLVPIVLLATVAWIGDQADYILVRLGDWVTRIAPNRYTSEL